MQRRRPTELDLRCLTPGPPRTPCVLAIHLRSGTRLPTLGVRWCGGGGPVLCAGEWLFERCGAPTAGPHGICHASVPICQRRRTGPRLLEHALVSQLPHPELQAVTLYCTRNVASEQNRSGGIAQKACLSATPWRCRGSSTAVPPTGPKFCAQGLLVSSDRGRSLQPGHVVTDSRSPGGPPHEGE